MYIYICIYIYIYIYMYIYIYIYIIIYIYVHCEKRTEYIDEIVGCLELFYVNDVTNT